MKTMKRHGSNGKPIRSNAVKPPDKGQEALFADDDVNDPNSQISPSGLRVLNPMIRRFGRAEDLEATCKRCVFLTDDPVHGSRIHRCFWNDKSGLDGEHFTYLNACGMYEERADD